MTNSKVVKPAGKKPPNAGKGRIKGVPNKATKEVKAALQEAFERRGGVDSLMEWADENPTGFYTLWGKLIPTEVKATHDGKMSFTIVTGVPGKND